MKNNYIITDEEEVLVLTLCGSLAQLDDSSIGAYRCERCNAVIGSIGMPAPCRKLYEMERMVDKLKGNQSV